jgi:hypothetical protein
MARKTVRRRRGAPRRANSFPRASARQPYRGPSGYSSERIVRGPRQVNGRLQDKPYLQHKRRARIAMDRPSDTRALLLCALDGTAVLRVHPFLTLFALALSAIAVYSFHCTFLSPLARYPGPFFARYTDFWRVRQVRAMAVSRPRIGSHITPGHQLSPA